MQAAFNAAKQQQAFPIIIAPDMWRHWPWLIGLVASPLLLGCINPEHQAIVGGLFALSLFTLAPYLATDSSKQRSLLMALAAFVLMLPVIPLPPWMIGILSPERLSLAKSFPLASTGNESWLPLTLSLDRTWQRLWELGLVISCFVLARHASQDVKFPQLLVWLIMATVFLEACSDLWLRFQGGNLILGIWENRWNYAAGTFPNRNHFSGYQYMCILFLVGALLRQLKPLRSARGGGPITARTKSGSIGLLCVIFMGGATAAASGSRGGVISFAAGLTVWMLLLMRRSRNRMRWIVFGTICLILVLFSVVFGELMLQRLATENSGLGFKLGIWTQSISILAKYALFGVGPGSFETAFSHYKSSSGDKTFWHAENDFVQLLTEHGILGGLLLGGIILGLLISAVRHALRSRLREPELFLGALAALAGFLIHACFEFVFQITANALLAATLLGLLTGMGDQTDRPRVAMPASNLRMMFNYAWACLLAIFAFMADWAHSQGLHGQAATSSTLAASSYKKAIQFWPQPADIKVSYIRAVVRTIENEPRTIQLRKAPAIRQELSRVCQRDPLNWEVRLELAWFDIAFLPNASEAWESAWKAVKLNPMQPLIPLRFAGHYSTRDPVTAMQFLKAVKSNHPQHLRAAYEIAWQAEKRPSSLWELTPDTDVGLLTLCDFAISQGLNNLAIQTCNLLSNRVDAVTLSKRYMQAGNTSQAVKILSSIPRGHDAGLLYAKALVRMRKPLEAIKECERLWQAAGKIGEIQRPFRVPKLNADPDQQGISTSQIKPDQALADLNQAQTLAESIFSLSAQERSKDQLQSLAKRFPKELRFLWMVYKTEMDLNQPSLAAESAIRLSENLSLP